MHSQEPRAGKACPLPSLQQWLPTFTRLLRDRYRSLTPKTARLLDAGVHRIGVARVSTLAQTSVIWSASVRVCFELNRRGAGKSLAALQGIAMVKRIAPIRVISFFLLAACGAFCQSDRPSADLLPGLQFDGSNSPELQRQEMRTWSSLPDAPSVLLSTQAEKFRTFADEVPSPLRLGAVNINARVMREQELGQVTPRLQPSLTAPYKAVLIPEEPRTFFDKYLYPSLRKQDPPYYPSTSGSFVGRATDAASRIFVTRNDAGKRRLNTSYAFLGVLTSVAIHTAYRPYWARSSSATFNNFGSTIGSGAGINLFREFGPGIRQMIRGDAPKLESRVGERIANDQTLKEVVSTPAR